MEKENQIAPEFETNKSEPADVNVEEASLNEASKSEKSVQVTKKRCPQCQAFLEDDKLFCPDCGFSLKKICSNCGTELSEDQLFCPECGNRANANPASLQDINEYNQNIAKVSAKKAKNKKLRVILVALLVVAVAVAGFFGYKYYKRQQVLAYVAQVEEYSEAVEETVYDLDMVNTAWDIVEDSSWLYYSSLKSYARSTTHASYISNAKSANDKIVEMYDEIKTCDIDDPYVEKIVPQIKKLQDQYVDTYYDIIIAEDGGNSYQISYIEDYLSELVDILDDAKEAYGSSEKK